MDESGRGGQGQGPNEESKLFIENSFLVMSRLHFPVE